MSDEELTKKQERIIQAAKRNKNATNKEIAEKANASSSYVSQVLNEQGDPRENSGLGLVGWLVIIMVLGVIGLMLAEGDGNGAEAAASILF